MHALLTPTPTLDVVLTLTPILNQVVALLRGGGSVVPRDVQGRTPLSVAAFKGHAAVVRLLLTHRALFLAFQRQTPV